MQIRNILLYQVGRNKTEVSVYFEKGSFWLSQKAIASLFGVDRTVVTKHLKNIFEVQELDENTVCAIFAHTADDGKSYETKFYRLEAILAVGYRVNSIQATDFRKWATTTLNEFIIKGRIFFGAADLKWQVDVYDETSETVAITTILTMVKMRGITC
jgi:hypothetical protein